jgi:hypothetical protein
MQTVRSEHRRPGIVLAAALIAATIAACADVAGTSTGIRTNQVSVPSDTIRGTGQLSELQQKRAAWVARRITDYRFELRISCFCAGDITRPVLIEVRSGRITKVWDLETVNPVRDITPYKTITGLFDAAIAERSRGGNVSVVYDRAFDIPVTLEVGTIANDAGVLYLLGGLVRL